MQARHKAVFQSEGSTSLQKSEIGPEILFGVESCDKTAGNELIEIGAVVIEPGVHVSRRPCFIRSIDTKAVDRDMGKPLLGKLLDIRFPVEMPRRPEASDEEITEVP